MSGETPDSLPKLPWWQRWKGVWLMCWVVWWMTFLSPGLTLYITGVWGDGAWELVRGFPIGQLIGRSILAGILFVVLALVLGVAFMVGRKVRSSFRWLVLIIPTLAVCGQYLRFAFENPQTSQRFFARHLGFPLPAEAQRYRGWHPTGGRLSEMFMGHLGIYRIDLSSEVVEAIIEREKGVLISEYASQPDGEQFWIWTRWTDLYDRMRTSQEADLRIRDPKAAVYGLTNQDGDFDFRFVVRVPDSRETYWVAYSPHK